ncbi:WD repeat-containing protein 37 [Diabrotica virgifera virgifera]|uniref:WD repeat-containing protein 37 n=1 Tax=Diabrotica virgifera virgifera TaxID=50390 RepID=A0A6P7FLH5_DIAVI|nr:WD repeat-containing protein 37 [Diabrotica virgifera virgifera]XP_050514176.1 WD repeat-containing protein 37 [Diabrotica virgifera virgifera]
MSVNQRTPNNKQSKSKRAQMARPSSGLIDSDFFAGFRSDIENESLNPPYKSRLYNLFRQIEKEFDLLYQENQTLHEKIELLNEKLEKDASEKPDNVEYESNLSKVLGKKLSSATQKNKTAHILKAQTSKIVSSFKAPQFACALLKEYVGHKDGIWEVSVARPGVPVVGSASADHTACLWSIDRAKCLLQYQGHTGSVNSIRFHPAKDLVLTGSGDCTAHIWQAALNWELPRGQSSEEELEADEMEDKSEINKIATLRTPFQELKGHTSPVASAEWLAGADQIITGGWDRLAILHDVDTGQLVTTLAGHDQELNHVATHPTQKLAVTSSRDTTFRLWDFRENVHSVSVFQGHAESVTSAVFNREDKVISSSDDRSVKVWDLRNMRSPTATIRVDSSVNRISVSSHGVIAIPHDNRHIRLYDLTGQRLARLPRSRRQGHSRMVSSVAWADDFPFGVNLFSAGFDRKVLGWSVQSMKD